MSPVLCRWAKEVWRCVLRPAWHPLIIFLTVPLRISWVVYYRFFGSFRNLHSWDWMTLVMHVILTIEPRCTFLANCLKPKYRNAYIKMRKKQGFLDDPPPEQPHYKGLIMGLTIGWLINGIGIGNSWRGWTGTVFGVGFGQRVKLVVFPLNALMWNDNLDSTSTQEKSGFKGILYFYDIFYF